MEKKTWKDYSPGQRRGMRIMMGIMGSIILIFCLVYITHPSPAESPKPQVPETQVEYKAASDSMKTVWLVQRCDERDVREGVQALVKPQLAFPLTADFDNGYNVFIVNADSQIVTLKGTVDCKNGFNVPTQVMYVVKLKVGFDAVEPLDVKILN